MNSMSDIVLKASHDLVWAVNSEDPVLADLVLPPESGTLARLPAGREIVLQRIDHGLLGRTTREGQRHGMVEFLVQ